MANHHSNHVGASVAVSSKLTGGYLPRLIGQLVHALPSTPLSSSDRSSFVGTNVLSATKPNQPNQTPFCNASPFRWCESLVLRRLLVCFLLSSSELTQGYRGIRTHISKYHSCAPHRIALVAPQRVQKLLLPLQRQKPHKRPTAIRRSCASIDG